MVSAINAFSLHVTKGQCVPSSAVDSGITEPVLTVSFSLPACCISFLMLVYLTAVQQAALESGYLVFWGK